MNKYLLIIVCLLIASPLVYASTKVLSDNGIEANYQVQTSYDYKYIVEYEFVNDNCILADKLRLVCGSFEILPINSKPSIIIPTKTNVP
jgi:hypothetical protein